jgi:hypothetical protein
MTNVINIEQNDGQTLDIEVTSNDRGATGADGTTFTPAMSSDGTLSWTNDGGKQNPTPINLKGATGATGATGTTFTPEVSYNGIISWTNDGGKSNPEARNIKGPKGDKGEDGAIHYTAGAGITITNNVIAATGTTSVAWGNIQGDINSQDDLMDIVDSLEGQIDTNKGSIDDINEKIPTQASASNQLADKDFVNSSVATNAAYFKGTFNSVSELPTTGVTNNDYAFVISTDSHGNTIYNRYKYSSETSAWAFEYALNNSSFTAVQWATVNSGMTSSDKTKLDGIETGAEVNVQSDWNEADTTADDYIKNKPTNLVEYENPTTITTTPWVNTVDIVDDAVTDEKIDFSSLGNYIVSGSSMTIPTTATTWRSYTIPADGTYFLIFKCGGNSGSSGTKTIYSTITNNDTQLVQGLVTTNNSYEETTSFTSATLSAGDVVAAKVRCVDVSITGSGNWSFGVIRIG